MIKQLYHQEDIIQITIIQQQQQQTYLETILQVMRLLHF